MPMLTLRDRLRAEAKSILDDELPLTIEAILAWSETIKRSIWLAALADGPGDDAAILLKYLAGMDADPS